MFRSLRSETLIVLMIVAIAVVSLWGYSAWSNHIAIQRKQAAFVKLQAAGVPMSAAARTAFASVPADVRDSTEEWSSLIADRLAISNRVFRDMGEEKLFAIPFVGLERDGKSIPPPKTEWDQEQNAGEYLQHFEVIIHRTRELASSDGAWRYISTKDLGDDEIHPLNQGYGNLGELLLLSSHVEARRGQSERAYEDLITVLRIVDAGRFEAEYYSVIDLGHLHRLASISAARLSVACNWTDQQLSELQIAISNADFKSRMKRAHLGEVGGNLTTLQTKPGSLEERFFSEDLSLYAELMLPVIEGYDNSWPDVFPSQAMFLQSIDDLQMKDRSRKRHTALFVISPHTAALYEEAVVTTAIQRSATTALGHQRYFLTKGEYPKSLSQLSSECPPADADITDPLVGGPLKSSMDAAGLVIYGVGMNKADDGGEVIPTEDRHHAKDAGLVHGW